ncbi:hypothetical protein [Yinghuangia sp. YIM S09857]|uniref:hypothetical protein n=1 Tax=Yinghuangia sp. YIM S09857 TaxID=3436929 RepID=UPI003F537D57
MIDESAVPDWPVVLIRMTSDGRAEVDGRPVVPERGEDARDAALQQAAHTADSLGRPVRVDAHEADGTLFPLVVDAAGTVTEVGPPVPPASERRGLLRRRRTAVAPPSAPAATPEPPEPEKQFTSRTRTPPVRAVAHASATDTDPSLPRPSPHQARVLDRVRGLAESGDQPAALRLLAELQPDADAEAAVALGEIRAYLAFLEGDAVRATRLYTDAALAWLRLRPTADDWALGLTECAHYTWTHVGDSEQVFDLGNELLAAYLALGIVDTPRADAARARLDDARTQLL